MKNRRQNMTRFSARILSIVLLIVAMIAVLPRQATAQAPQARSKECEDLLQRTKEVKDSLIRRSSARTAVRVRRGIVDVEIRNFPERQDSLRKLALQLAAQERELDKLVEDSEKSLDALLEQLADCCCPKDKKTTEGPDVPGLEEEVGMTPFKPNQAVGLFSVIREDSTPRFNTYGFNGTYTRFINSTVGITGDFNAHFREQNGTDLSKISSVGGFTFVPFDGAKTTDKATVSFHALFGVSRFKADSGVGSFTDNAFMMKLGAALDVNAFNNFYIRLGQVDYAPTRFGGEAQHNFQVGFGAGVRWQ